MPYDLGVIKRQRREPPIISTSTYGGNFVGFYSTGTSYYAVHVFTSSGQFTKPSYVTTTTAQVLVVAGGGGGGGPATASGVGGGGGAGGVINSSTYSITGTLTILIGAGGATNAIGSASTLTSSVTVLTASGGGGGGAPLNGSGYEGGSGGGGSGTGTGGTSTSTQGNAGGAGGSQTSYAGGGGGANAAGGAANASAAGQGGSGTITLITGSPIWVAGGGGGGANATGYNNGSYGGGGSGGTTSVVAGTAGDTNSGGGGGGGGGTTGAGGAGGSGIVIISYAIPANLYPITQSDPYFSNNALLLNAGSVISNVINNVIADVFSDFSTNNWGLTNKSVIRSTLNPFDPGLYHSLYFNGSSYITVPVGSLPALTTDFTVEFWMYAASSDNLTNHWLVGTSAVNGFYVFHRNNYINIGQLSVIIYTSPTAFSLNQWTHVAVVRASNIFNIYQNGTSVLTQSWNPTLVSGAVNIGGLPSQAAFHTGYLSNIRATLSAVYTGNFALPSEQLSTIQNAFSANMSAISSGVTLLTGRFLTTSSSIVDYSTLTNTISVTGVTASMLNPFNSLNYDSASFDVDIPTPAGYIIAPANSGYAFETGDFTVELWVYLNRLSESPPAFVGSWRLGLITKCAWIFTVGFPGNGGNPSNLRFGISNGVSNLAFYESTGGLSINNWIHIAAVRNGTTLTLYSNGTAVSTHLNVSTNISVSSQELQINGPYGFGGVPGYMSNLRIIKGLAVYTGNFTVPNGPLQLTQVANPYGGTNTRAIPTVSSVSLLTLKYHSFFQNNTFLDFGTNTLNITPKGDPGQGTFSPFGNNWSTLFNGTTDHLSIPVIYSSSATLSKFNIGFNDFTIETWAYLTVNTGTAYIAGQLNASNYAPMGLYISSNQPTLGISNVGSRWDITVTSPTAISTGTWYHIAAVRNGTRFSMYLNGVEQSFGVSSAPSADISINTATVVTTNVTNSTINPYDQGPYHSLYFNGTSYLSVPDRTNLNMLGVDFTMECWIYLTATPGGSNGIAIFGKRATNSVVAGVGLGFGAGLLTPQLLTTVNGTAWGVNITSTIAVLLNAWAHVSVTRLGNIFTLWVNGGSGATVTLAGTIPTNTAAFTIGATSADGTAPFNGYISNVRIVKGLALYTSAFLLPQSLFSTIQSATPGGALANLTTNTTQLLIGRFVNQRYFFDDYSSNNFTLTNNGGVAAANLSPPITSTSTFNSMYFNGSNYLITPTNTVFQFGTGNFTIECWWYQSVSNTARGFVSSIAANSARGVQLCGNGAFTGLNSAGSYDTFAWTLPLNQWNHVAFVRINGTAYAYVNGVLASSGPTTLGNNLTGSALVIGTSYTNNFTFSAVGYISNLRIVKGTALYTGNFTLPVSQLTNISDTSLLIAKSSAIIGEGLNQLTADFSIAPISVTTGTANNSLFSPSNLYPPISSTSTLYNSVNIPGNLTNAKIDYTNTAFATGTGDFTVECWVWMNSLTSSVGGILASCSATVPGFIIARDQFGVYNANGSGGQGFTWTFPTNAWAHVALCIQSGWLGGWLNGVSAGSPIIRTAGSLSSTTISLGRRYTSDIISLIGYISNLRFVAGLAVYNTGTSFTRPTGPLTATQSANPFGGSNTQAITASTSTKLLTLLSTSATNIVDYSTNTSVITMSTGSVSLSTLDPFSAYTSTNFHSLYFGGNGSIAPSPALSYAAGSLLFNGTTQYLSATKTGGWLSSDHTVEAWIYLNAYTSPVACIAGESNGSTVDAWEWYVTASVIAIAYRLSGTLTTISASTTFSLSTWYHVAFSRSGTTVRLFVNGVQVSSGTITSWTPQNILSIGYLESSFPYRFNGYITNFRMVNGTAVYTSNFTPLLPLSNITNTTILLLVNSDANKIVDSSSTPVTFTNNGVATFSSTVIPSTPSPWLNYGDHTVEAWINLDKLTSANMLIAGTYNGVRTAGWTWTINNYFMSLKYETSGQTLLTRSFDDQLTQLLTIRSDSTAYGAGASAFVVNETQILSDSPSPIVGYYGSMKFHKATNPFSKTMGENDAYGFLFGSGDFTIEVWALVLGTAGVGTMIDVNQSHIPGNYAIGQFVLSVNPVTSRVYFDYTASNSSYTSLSGPMPNTGWIHIAVVRSGSAIGNLKIYVNGSVVATSSAAITQNMGIGDPSGAIIWIGFAITSAGGFRDPFIGNLSNLRIVKNLAIYTGNFTPQTSTPLSDTQTAGTNIQTLSTGTWTSLLLGVSTATMPVLFAPDTWNHVAFTRLGTTATMYINGVATSSTQITSYTEQNNLRLGYIGYGYTATTYLTGYISNFRIVSGVAVYTGTNFVPPTGILTTQQPPNPYSGTNTNAITFTTSTRIATALFNGVNISPYNTNTNMLIGRAGSAVTSVFPGYLSNLRIVNGTAVYTSNFIPSRAPSTILTNTSLLIAASSRHVDISGNNFIVTTGTVASLPAITKFTPYKIPGEYNKSVVGGSVYFNTTTAASQNLSIGAQPTLALGSGNYTVELWIYPISYNTANSALIDWRTNAGTTAGVPVLYLLSTGLIQWQNTGGTGFLTSPNRIPLNTWNHIYMSRYNSILHMFINGEVTTSTSDATALSIQTMFINSPITASNQTLFGYISNVRIVVGTAVYLPTISVPTSTLTTVTNTVLLTLQNDAPAFKDNSVNNFTLTNPTTSTPFQQVLSPFGGSGSAYFNGRNNYLIISTGTNTAFAFGNGDFTIEAWIYPTARNIVYGSLIIGGITYTTILVSADWFLIVNLAGYLYFQIGTSSSSGVTSSSKVSLNVWTHVAVVRLNGSTKFYLNGKISASTLVASVTTTSTTAAGSLSFNGTSSSLSAGNSSDWAFLSNGTQDWTVETWFYTNLTTERPIFATSYSGPGFFSGAYGIYCSVNPTTGIISITWVQGNQNGSIISTYGGLFNSGSWYHLAITFISSTRTAKIFLNGILRITGIVSVGTFGGSDYPLLIGSNPGLGYFSGYMSNFRIAKYVTYGGITGNTNFTPVLPLTTITNTQLLLLVNTSTAAFTDSSSVGWSLSNTATVTYNNTVVPTTSYNLTGGLRFNSAEIRVGAAANWTFLHNALQDYTLECWFYTTSTAYQNMLGTSANTPYSGIEFSINYSNGVSGGAAQGSLLLGFNRAAGGQNYLPNTVAGLFSTSTWNHAAVTFTTSTKTVTFFVNGVTQSVAYNSGSQSNTAFTYNTADPNFTLYVGAAPPTGNFDGYLSNVRITKSILYTGNFILPITELATTQLADTNISAIFTASYVSLLTAQHFGLVDTSTYAYSIVNFGAVYSSSISPNISYNSTVITSISNNQNISIGGTLNTTSTSFTGYISNIQVLNIPKYSTAFIPHIVDLTTSPNSLLLTLLSTDTTIIDNSSNSFAITNSTTATTLQGFSPFSTNYSVYFSNGYLNVSNAQSLNLSSSTGWTIETWVNPTGIYSTVTDSILFAKRNSVSGQSTYNSIYFSNGYLGIVAPTNTPVMPSSLGDFTIECWVNFPSSPTNNGIFHFSTSYFGNGAGVTMLAMAASNTGWIICYGINLSNQIVATLTPAANVWYHIALVRYVNVLKIYINGISYIVASNDTTDYSVITNLVVGAYFSAGYPAVAYVSNFRVVKDLAVYIGDNFNLPFPALETTQVVNPDGGRNTQAISTSSYTTLLVAQFVGSADAILDYSDYNFNITSFGTLTSDPLNVGYGGSLTFNGANQYLTIAAGASKFGTGAWTIECWIYVNLLELALIIIDTRQTISPYAGVQLSVQINGSLVWYEGASTLVIQTDAAVVKTNKWYHVAIVRNGAGQCNIYLNGISKGSGTSTLNHIGYTTYIGRNSAAAQSYFNGYISNLRIVTGGAVYTGDFTPPASQLNNTQTANISGSPSISIPDSAYSVIFNGSTQYLNVSGTNSQFAFGTGDFTIEMWIYQTARSATNGNIYDSRPAGTGSAASHFVIGVGPAGEFYAGPGTISLNTWYHIAVCRSGTTLTAYVNGVQVYSVTNTTNWLNGTNRPTIGTDGNVPLSPGYIFNGYISNLRVVNGIAVYTGNFTPSINPLTSTQTTGTNILAIPNDVVANGSLTFNGSTQYLTIPARLDFDLSYKSFTMECWVYVTSVAVVRSIWTLGTNGSATYTHFGIDTNLSVFFQTNVGTWAWNATYSTPAASISLNTWTHVAAVRNYPGGTFKIYVNGTEQFTTNSFSEPVINNWLLYSGNAFIGSYYGAQNQYFQGYITNFRLVKGVAVYSGAFTVPTTPLYITQAAGTNISAINTASNTVLFIDRRISDTSLNRATITNVAAVTVATLGPFITNNTGTVLLTAQSFNIIDNSKNNFSIGNSGGIIAWTVNPFVSTSTTLLINNTNTATGFSDKSSNSFAITNINVVNTTTAYPFGITLQPSTSYQGYLSSNGGYLGFYDGTTYSTATVSLSSGTWSHVAYTYDFPNSSVNIYVNGFRVLETTSIIIDNDENLNIGGIGGSNEYFYGYMSNLRIIKGSSLYLGSYFGAVPTSALTTITNTVPYPNTSTISTSLLTLQTGNITDNSTNRYTFTIGGTGTIKTSVFAPFAANPNLSTYFNGTTDFINVSAQNALSFGTGDFTIEVWVYPTLVPTGYAPVLEARASVTALPWVVGMRTSGGVLKAEFWDGIPRTAPTTIQLFTWTHLAWTRTNSTLRIFVNGQIDLTSSNNITSMNAQGTNQLIGKLWDGTGYIFQGFMSNLRVVKGTSLYTGNFNPSKLPLTPVVGTATNLLTTFVNIRAVEYSGNTVVKANTSTLTLGTVTKNNLYSISFNGTSDFLSVSSSTGFSYNANDFTWEMWIYPTTPNWVSTTTVLLDHTGGVGGLFVSNNRLVYYNSTVITTTASNTLIVNSSTWTHIAAARSNNVTSLFVNGAFATSITDSNNYNISRALVIGTTSTGLINYFRGYIEDVRITKGVARYTASFVPPIKLSNR